MIASHFLRSVSLNVDAAALPDVYPFNIPGIRQLRSLAFHPKVTFLVGDNGMGKSTLLEALAVRCGMNAEGGGRNFNFATRQTHSPLHEYLDLVRGFDRPTDDYFLRAESFYNLASNIEEIGISYVGYGGKSLHAQSHGESFWNLIENRFVGHGLYLLDEPEAALSPTRQMGALSLIHQLVHQHSQFIIATHSPILMAYPDATIYQMSETGINPVAYEDTEHYTITRDFLNHTQTSLRALLSED
jgi:predicted ATPase